MESFLLGALGHYQILSYAVIFIGTFITADLVAYSAGFLSQQGYLNLPLTLLSLAAGSLFTDWLWYYLGTKTNNHNYFFNRWLHRVTRPVDNHLRQRTLRTLIISKFAYSLHHGILLKAGALKLPLKPFLKYDLLAVIAWMAIFFSFGYSSSAAFWLVRKYLRYAELAFLAGLGLFTFFSYLFAKYFQKRL